MRFATIALVFLGLCTLVVADDIPGLVDEQPASGRYVKTDRGFMVSYTVTIPGTAVTFEMIPIPGGEFLLGSPESEAGRKADEGPQVRVKTRPFWMGKNEIRWAEYKAFMGLNNIFSKFREGKIRLVTEDNQLDAITAPTELYYPEFTFKFGEEPELPAVSMTLYAARQYTKWLSAVTGQQYRVPTESEWEYAAEGGAKTAYSFGDDPARLAAYGWFADTSQGMGPRKVGLGKPNAYGLHDMHGNVAEWVQDEYHADGYARLQAKTADAKGHPLGAFDVLGKPQVHDSRVLRGGSWQSPASECRSASRFGSDYSVLKKEDPNLPKSPWWMTDDPCRSIGFRLLRSIDELPRDQIEQFWNIDSEALQFDVDTRILQGRGLYGIVDKDLPQAVKTLKAGK